MLERLSLQNQVSKHVTYFVLHDDDLERHGLISKFLIKLIDSSNCTLFDAFVLCNMTRSYFSLCFIKDFYPYLKIIQALWPCWIICYIFPKISGWAQTFRRAELARSLGICPSVRSIFVNNHPIFILPPNLIQHLRFLGRITVLMEFPNSNIKTRGSSSMTVSMHNISIPPICVLGSIPSSNAGIN